MKKINNLESFLIWNLIKKSLLLINNSGSKVKNFYLKLTSEGWSKIHLNIFLNNLMKIKMFKKIFSLIKNPTIYKLHYFCETDSTYKLTKWAFFKTFILYRKESD